jgi:hypothetical protein
VGSYEGSRDAAVNLARVNILLMSHCEAVMAESDNSRGNSAV